jgi:hypothetical protein
LESPIVIDVWSVEPEQQDELVAAISEVLTSHVVGQPGFVSAQIYQSANRDVVVMNLRMRSASDRQALSDGAALQEAYRGLRKIASSHRHLYSLAESFGAPPPEGEDQRPPSAPGSGDRAPT